MTEWAKQWENKALPQKKKKKKCKKENQRKREVKTFWPKLLSFPFILGPEGRWGWGKRGIACHCPLPAGYPSSPAKAVCPSVLPWMPSVLLLIKSNQVHYESLYSILNSTTVLALVMVVRWSSRLIHMPGSPACFMSPAFRPGNSHPQRSNTDVPTFADWACPQKGLNNAQGGPMAGRRLELLTSLFLSSLAHDCAGISPRYQDDLISTPIWVAQVSQPKDATRTKVRLFYNVPKGEWVEENATASCSYPLPTYILRPHKKYGQKDW